MNERRLLALLMLALVSFGFIACEEDESLKDRAAKLKGSHGYYFRTEDDRSISVGDTVDLYYGNFHIATEKYVDKNYNDIDVNNEVKYDFYFGKSPDRMEPVDAQDVNIDFLDVCYGKIVEYITSGDERCDVSEIGPFVIRYIPNNNIYCETEYGKGGNNEFSNWIKVKLYYYNGTKKDENKKDVDSSKTSLTESISAKDAEIKRILHRSSAQTTKIELDVKVGDQIRIVSGPFSDFMGEITEVYPDKSKIRASVSIFGRETPVELEYKQIQKV